MFIFTKLYHTKLNKDPQIGNHFSLESNFSSRPETNTRRVLFWLRIYSDTVKEPPKT